MSEKNYSSIMLAILAAGQSSRFGDQDKLATLLGGKMLGLHVSDNLRGISFSDSTIIAPKDEHPCAKHWRQSGYDILINEKADQGQSTSVRLAALQAQSQNADALCICLADTPFISAAHITQLVSEFNQQGRLKIVASSDGENIMPPAIFPASQFNRLTVLDGDKGARSLLLEATIITYAKSNMLDIDTPNDLVTAEDLL
ncbi:MAG: nucleotidyltransferase family protein [Parasphingorhabdus sp.]